VMAALIGAVRGVVGGVVGGVAGVAGGVVGVAGGVVGGVVGGARVATRYALGIPNQETNTLDDEPNIYEQRTRVDQVLQFFELEYERHEGYVEDAKRLEGLRIEYYNCINAIEFQNELIAQLVDELLELRSSFRAASVPQRKEIRIRLEHARLDIGDRKNKRFFKEKERKNLLQTLSPLITEIKMGRLLDHQESEIRAAEDSRNSTAGRSDTGSKAQTDMASEEAWCTQMEAHQTSVKSRRRYKHYSDQELNALLRDTDG